MPDIAFVNTDFFPLEEAKISINDRGFLFGDSVYETLSIYNSCPFLFEEHLARLRSACAELQIKASRQIDSLQKIIEEGVAKTGYKDCAVYVQVTRGVQKRTHFIDASLEASLVVTFRKHIFAHSTEHENGVRAILRRDIRGKYCHLKTTNLLGNILLKNEAKRQGAFEAILFQDDGTVSECCSSSLFIVEKSRVLTAPASPAVLPGVLRGYVLEVLAKQCGFSATEEYITVERLLAADEVFITATSYLVLPVVEVDAHPIGSGKPGAKTLALLNEGLKNLKQFKEAK